LFKSVSVSALTTRSEHRHYSLDVENLFSKSMLTTKMIIGGFEIIVALFYILLDSLRRKAAATVIIFRRRHIRKLAAPHCYPLYYIS